MKHVPCIPDAILPLQTRRRLGHYETNTEALVKSRQAVALVDPQRIAANYRELLAAIDRLAGAYLAVAGERDQYKGVCDLATDDRFWKALQVLRELGGGPEAPEEEGDHGKAAMASK